MVGLTSGGKVPHTITFREKDIGESAWNWRSYTRERKLYKRR